MFSPLDNTLLEILTIEMFGFSPPAKILYKDL